jgi:hypothetical protein
MWSVASEEHSGRRGLRFAVTAHSRPASVADVINAWQNDAGFRSFFNTLLASSPFTAFRWETPGITAASAPGPFEFVLLDSPGLVCRPDRLAFREHFADADSDVAVFPNLGNDAIMVVPCPISDASAYGHLGAFVRHAPESQRHNLWRTVGEAMAKRLGERPVWLNTAGAGVAWLHVRLDDRPKYYGYEPYRSTRA